MNNANIFREFYVLSEKWCEMVRKIRQRLATIIFGGSQQLSTIGNNFFLFEVNNYQQLPTIILEWSTIINNYQQFARDYLRGQRLATIRHNFFSLL